MSDSISARRMNDFIDCINAGKPKSELVPPIQNEHEDAVFEHMESQLAQMRKKDPRASFCHVDFEWGVVGDHGGDFD